ncbi:MAG: PTS sugar transporter subunit IIA [Erysipelotrichaceae bacterium]|nr:PTS sugar transporter subunit IIA [Erysipelotrichaceae bacterium]
MIGIAICTHSNFADGLKDACNMIMGNEQERLVSLGFTNEDELLDFSEKLKNITRSFDEGCIYAVDLMNSSPFNASLLCIANTNDVVLSGVNLPMMLELLTYRTSIDSPKDLAQKVLNNYKSYVDLKTSDDVFK